MIRIGAKQETGPLALLKECHRRIERFLYVLITIYRQAHGGELSEEQREAMKTALRYFQNAAPKHTQDEEESLFPRMRGLATIDALDALEQDHEIVEESHSQVGKLCERWLDQGYLDLTEAVRLGERLCTLSARYHRHIRVEEQDIFPLACHILPPDQLEDVRREMADRRH